MNTLHEEIFYSGRHPVLANVLEGLGCLITMALFVVLAWLFCIATPDQYSAECEACRSELEAISR